MFAISGPCTHDDKVESGDLINDGGNGSNDILLSVFPLGPDGGWLGDAGRRGHDEFDVRIS